MHMAVVDYYHILAVRRFARVLAINKEIICVPFRSTWSLIALHMIIKKVGAYRRHMHVANLRNYDSWKRVAGLLPGEG